MERVPANPIRLRGQHTALHRFSMKTISQYFPVIYTEVDRANGRCFAVIVDETGAYTYEMPQNLSMVAGAKVQYGEGNKDTFHNYSFAENKTNEE